MGTLGTVFKYVFVSLLIFSVFALFSLLLFEQTIPPFLLKRFTDRISNDTYYVSAESASFRFAHGFKVRNLRVWDRRTPAAKPALSAAIVDIELDLCSFPWRKDSLLKSATVTELKYPRLPQGYYIPDSIEFPGHPDFREVNSPVELDLPTIKPFRLTLIRPEILDVKPHRVDFPHVAVTPTTLEATAISLQWPDTDIDMTLAGQVKLDLVKQLVSGDIHGLARQHHIRPMLVALDITNSYQFVDSFTKVEKPVDAGCKFDVDLRKNDLHLLLDLKPEVCFHNKVPLKNATGTVDLRVFVRDTYQNARIVVGPVNANLADGSKMEGTIIYENTNDVGFVDFDVQSNATLSNALAIADVMNDGTLDCLVPETAPHVTLNGRMAVKPDHAQRHNDLRGSLNFNRGTLFAIPLRNASTDFRLKGTDLTFSNARATAPHGGAVTGDAQLSIPDFKQDHATFTVNLKGEALSLQDLADIFGVDPGEKHGTVNGNVTLTGPLATNAISRLCGQGHLVCTNGHLAQMKLFAGLTDFLAKKVPGVATVVNQSRGEMDFTLTNGVFHASRLIVEGGFFSIEASGTHDIPKNELNFTARLKLAKNDSLLSTIATPIAWSVGNLTKMFFDIKVKVHGTLDDAKWEFGVLKTKE